MSSAMEELASRVRVPLLKVKATMVAAPGLSMNGRLIISLLWDNS